MNLKDLAKPFPAQDIEWRVGRAGISNDGKPWAMVLAYITARAIMDRLDETVGPENWKDRYWKEGNAVMCGLSIKVGKEWIEKVDGAEETEIEPVKGGVSGALKRAAVKWGVGRYLYNLEEGFAQVHKERIKGSTHAKAKGQDNKDVHFYWTPPALPDWALPGKSETPPTVGNSHLKAVPGGAAEAFADASDPGSYVITFGQKFKGMALKDCDANELRNWANYLRNTAADKKKQLDGVGLEAVTAIGVYLASLASREATR